MASVKIIIRNDKINQKTGLAPLYIRIIKDRTSKFISLGIKIEPKYWNEEKMNIRKGATNYQELNNFIIQKRAEAEKISLDLESITSNLTSSAIKIQIKGKKSKNFFEYADKKFLELKHKIVFSTLKNYKGYISKFEKFCGTRNVKFNDINLNFIKEVV